MKTIVDLTQELRIGAPHVPSQPPFAMKRLREVGKDQSTVTELSMTTHAGTHVDAPIHMIIGGRYLHDYSPAEFCGSGVCLPVTTAPEDPITVAQLRRAGDVQPGDIVFIHTGWGARFAEEGYYRHPYISDQAAEWLVDCGARVVGIDALGPELPCHLRKQPFSFPVHKRLLGRGILIVENLAHLEQLPWRRFDVIIAPLRLDNVDGAPCRVLAFAPGTLT